MESQATTSQGAHTSRCQSAATSGSTQAVREMPEWMRRGYDMGCTMVRGRAATAAVLMDEVHVHGESRLAMAQLE